MPTPTTACVLFDLDGTLADTAPDLYEALQRLSAEQGRPPIAYGEFRNAVSHGTRAMLKSGLGIEPGDPDYALLQQRFLDLYLSGIAPRTQLFEGMAELLERLEAEAIPWGVVTNKPARLTEPLMRELGLMARAAVVVSGDTTEHAKPHPEPLLHACRLVGAEPSRTLYLGDAERDIEAGRSAGARTLVALFGYLSESDTPEQWQADGAIARPMELLEWL